MRILIISGNVLVREGLFTILSRNDNFVIQQSTEAINDIAKITKREHYDIIFFQLGKSHTEELMKIKELIKSGINSKFIFVDVYNSNEFFIRCLKVGVEGYISGKSSEVEILHILDQTYKGYKYFDKGHIEKNKLPKRSVDSHLENLTPREMEILCEIGKGLSNKKISDKFYISEHTVKKHINHIFDKLDIRDRTKVAIYANRLGLVPPIS